MISKSSMRVFGTAFIALAMAGLASVRIAQACSCPPPPPPPPGAQPALRVPSLHDKDGAVFVAAIEEVFPGGLSEYESRWQKIYHETLSEKRPPSVDRMREFIQQFWPTLFSPRERDRMAASKTLDDLESAVVPFWLTPRRIRVRVEESFSGPAVGVSVLYTGLGGGDCGLDFRVGERWLIETGVDSAGRWIAHQCSVTLPVNKARAILIKLRAERQ